MGFFQPKLRPPEHRTFGTVERDIFSWNGTLQHTSKQRVSKIFGFQLRTDPHVDWFKLPRGTRFRNERHLAMLFLLKKSKNYVFPWTTSLPLWIWRSLTRTWNYALRLQILKVPVALWIVNLKSRTSSCRHVESLDRIHIVRPAGILLRSGFPQKPLIENFVR